MSTLSPCDLLPKAGAMCCFRACVMDESQCAVRALYPWGWLHKLGGACWRHCPKLYDAPGYSERHLSQRLGVGLDGGVAGLISEQRVLPEVVPGFEVGHLAKQRGGGLHWRKPHGAKKDLWGSKGTCPNAHGAKPRAPLNRSPLQLGGGL